MRISDWSSDVCSSDLRVAYEEKVKQARYAKVGEVKAKAKALFAETDANPVDVSDAFKPLEAQVVRFNILDTGLRIDRRDTKTVRPNVSDVRSKERRGGKECVRTGSSRWSPYN